MVNAQVNTNVQYAMHNAQYSSNTNVQYATLNAQYICKN